MPLCAMTIRVILLLVIHGLHSAWSHDPVETRESFCAPFPGILLDSGKISKLADGRLVHEKLVYPVGAYRVLGNETYGCVCKLRPCLKKCCRSNEILGSGDRPNCTLLPSASPVPDLALRPDQLATEIRGISNVKDLFVVVEDMNCSENRSRYMLEPDRYAEDKFVLEENGTLRTSLIQFPVSDYCFDWKESFETIGVVVCTTTDPAASNTDPKQEASHKIGIIISIPFFLATFLVYAIIPELRSLYGKTLMCYVACLILAYTFLVLAKLLYLLPAFCSAIAFIIHFSFLASFFWLNVMCFDIWWTFGGFRALRGTVKQRERKKFAIYSIYAWGCASVLSGVCIIMDLLPSIPDYFIRPEFGAQSCWFATDMARAIYFYGPMGITVVCNICLFILTAVKIVQHKNDTAHHLKGVDSKRHDDNKQWFNLYLKLFIVMGITWSMEIISWLFNNSPSYIWYLSDLVNTLQGVIIFLIFVWKQKIRRLLLKRLGCQGRDFLSRNSTRSAYHSSASRTCTTSAAPLQEKITSYSCEAHRPAKPTTNHDSA